MSTTDDFAERLAQLRDAADDFGDELSTVFWSEFDTAGYQRRGCFVKTAINGIIDKSGMDQQDIARDLGVSNAALCAWKKGKISPRQIDRLWAYARYVIKIGVPLPDIPADVAEAASAMMRMMQRFRELLQESPKSPLDHNVYACVREAAGCPAWFKARNRGDYAEAATIAAALLARTGAAERPPRWFHAVVGEWWPLFIVCVDHIRSGS